MPYLIFFLIISLPVIEVASIIQVSRWVGPFATFLLLAAGATFGLFLIRSQGTAMGRRALEAMQAGTPPEQALLGSGAVIAAGVLFMIPGFFTDILALLLLIPAARRLDLARPFFRDEPRNFYRPDPDSDMVQAAA